jgi:hypothetical protein
MKRALFAALLLGLATPRVQAFSDPNAFALSTPRAGGDGRYFTGSPADGYTCKVCHAGGTEPRLLVTGLPVDAYRPGASYEIVVDWPDSFEKFSLALELTDLVGQAAGSLRLPPQAELEPPELCEPVGDRTPAASLAATASGRSIVQLPDCGAKRVRLLWTAPARDVGQVVFAGSAVASNGEGDTAGDGVTDFGRALGSPAAPAVRALGAGQCNAAAVGGEHRASLAWGWLAALSCSLLSARRASGRGTCRPRRSS